MVYLDHGPPLLDDQLAGLASGAHLGLLGVFVPRPVVPEEQLGKDVKGCLFGPAIEDLDAVEDVLGVGLCLLDVDVPVAIVIEDAGVDELDALRNPNNPADILTKSLPTATHTKHADYILGLTNLRNLLHQD